MSTSKWPKLDNNDSENPPPSVNVTDGEKKQEEGGECPRCGKPGNGPYSRRVGKNKQLGHYFCHTVMKNGIRSIIWHYVPKGSVMKRRKELLRLIGKEGWNGFSSYTDRLKVSERTIRRYVSELRASGMLIHRPHGGYIADPTGAILKKYPWLAWED